MLFNIATSKLSNTITLIIENKIIIIDPLIIINEINIINLKINKLINTYCLSTFLPIISIKIYLTIIYK